ncbi:hypothetical protein WJX77_000470 [Trebouxia sp. C0004]
MCRQVERVHAAVVGAHERHACLLPLEVYLEEGIPLVCYLPRLPVSREAGVEAEVDEGGADPDTWVETPYALRQPCSLHEETGEPKCKLGLDGTWQRPWADEMHTQECTDEDVAEQADRDNRCSDVEVLLVRCVEKEIDNLDGKLKDTAWNALVTTSQSLRCCREYMQRLIYLVQKALGTAGVDAPLNQAEAFLADLHPNKCPNKAARRLV